MITFLFKKIPSKSTSRVKIMLPNFVANAAFKTEIFLDHINARIRTSDFKSSVIQMMVSTRHLIPQLQIIANENGEITTPSHLGNFFGVDSSFATINGKKTEQYIKTIQVIPKSHDKYITLNLTN